MDNLKNNPLMIKIIVSIFPMLEKKFNLKSKIMTTLRILNKFTKLWIEN